MAKNPERSHPNGESQLLFSVSCPRLPSVPNSSFPQPIPPSVSPAGQRQLQTVQVSASNRALSVCDRRSNDAVGSDGMMGATIPLGRWRNNAALGDLIELSQALLPLSHVGRS